MIYSRIEGTGHHLPEKILTNADLEKMVETSDEWIKTRTGVERRHIASEDESTSSIGIKAAQKAISDANISKDDIDLIVVESTSMKFFSDSKILCAESSELINIFNLFFKKNSSKDR